MTELIVKVNSDSGGSCATVVNDVYHFNLSKDCVVKYLYPFSDGRKEWFDLCFKPGKPPQKGVKNNFRFFDPDKVRGGER